jgi:hypothetical protein
MSASTTRAAAGLEGSQLGASRRVPVVGENDVAAVGERRVGERRSDVPRSQDEKRAGGLLVHGTILPNHAPSPSALSSRGRDPSATVRVPTCANPASTLSREG